MEDRLAVVTAVGVVVAAVLAPAVPTVALVAVVALAVLTRLPPLVALAVVAAVGGRAQGELAALQAPLPDRVAGVAELVSDPEPGPFGDRVLLSVAGRRWSVAVPRDLAHVVGPLATGDRVVIRATTRPLTGVPEGWARSRHLAGRLVVEELRPGPPGVWWYRGANTLRRVLDQGTRPFTDQAGALYLGLVVGDDREQDSVTAFRFRAAGLGHLLAVSGQNVAFVLAVARPLLERCGLRTRWLVGVAVLGAFVLVTRAEASVLRAVVMASVVLVADALGRVAPPARVVALAVVALLAVDPLMVHSWGFRLSVAATVGLVVLARPLGDALRGPRPVREALAVTVAAQLGTLPVLLAVGDGVPAASLPANVLAVPAAGAVMVLGLTVGMAAGALREPAVAVAQVPARLLVGWIDGVAGVASRLPLPVLGPGRLTLVALSVGTWAVARRRGSRRGRTAAVAAAVALAVAALRPIAPPPGELVLAQSSVTSGRCGGRVVVVAGAREPGAVLEELWRVGVVAADLVAVPGPTGGRVGSVAMGREVAEQLGATLAATGAPGAGIVALDTTGIRVGSVRVAAGDRGAPVATAGRWKAACSVSP